MRPAPARSMPPPPGLHLSGISLRYGGETLFERLSLDLAAGSFTVLLGASGVGKTSLLRIAGGLDPAGDGSGGAGRVNSSDGLPLAGRIAWMAQHDLLCPWLNVRDNVMLGARLRGVARETSRAESLLDEVGLAGRGALMPGALSGGMRQRVALARTLYEDRPVVLMDEPFSALDSPTRARIQDLAARLLAGRTVLLITHDALEACRLADRLLLLSGRPASLTEQPTPGGATPRPTDDPSVLAAQAGLLRALIASNAATGAL